MRQMIRSLILAALLVVAAGPAHAAKTVAPAPVPAADPRMAERSLGKADAPIVMDEFLSLTCSHCADFTTKTLPKLEKNYIETGKLRIVYHDFPLDGISLKAAALARCVPADNYFPYIKLLYANQSVWAFGNNPIDAIVQYAVLAGLSRDKAEACMGDTKLLDAIVAERTEATKAYSITATPSFIVNKGQAAINGAQNYNIYADTIDGLLGHAKASAKPAKK